MYACPINGVLINAVIHLKIHYASRLVSENERRKGIDTKILSFL